MLGIIGGSGLAQISGLEAVRRKVVRTPYGEPSGALTFGEINGQGSGFSGTSWLWSYHSAA